MCWESGEKKGRGGKKEQETKELVERTKGAKKEGQKKNVEAGAEGEVMVVWGKMKRFTEKSIGNLEITSTQNMLRIFSN